jgi:hypothetical protein
LDLFFANNFTLTTLINSDCVYHKDKWQEIVEQLLGQPLSSYDAIVMGYFNPMVSSVPTKFNAGLTQMYIDHPELFDENFTSPTVDRLANIYQGGIVTVSMFAPRDQYVLTTGLDTMNYWRNQTNRANIQVVDGRKHIEAMGVECGSDDPITVGQCDNINKVAHRCCGPAGGHADLVAWDVIEELYRVVT